MTLLNRSKAKFGKTNVILDLTIGEFCTIMISLNKYHHLVGFDNEVEFLLNRDIKKLYKKLGKLYIANLNRERQVHA